MNPSLLLIPDRYKAGKLYSQIPDTGAGDLSFTRVGDTATRVNSQGLIEKVRTNLVLQSQAFNTTAPWFTNASPTITANTTVAPDGTTTADTIAATASFSGVYQSFGSVSNGVEYSWSVYIKNISSASNIFLGVVSNPSTATLNFDATSGTIIATGGSITSSSVTSVGSGWYRLSGTYISTGTSTDIAIYGMGTMSFAVWGAQLETGVTTAYIPTTTAAVSVGMLANIPRIDYTGGGCGKLLLEPQRTNLLTFSEQFDNANWDKIGGSFTTNATTSPDGTQNADLFTADGANSIHDFYQTFGGSTANSVSIFVKKGTARYINFIINYFSTGGDWCSVVFDLDSLTYNNDQAGDVTISSVNIQSYSNGWYRLNINANCALATTLYTFIGVVTSANPTRGSRGRVPVTSSATFYAWGAQVEAGSYPTSYIPTLGASVTRGADAASKTGISSLIGQTEGTLYWEFTFDTAVAANHECLINLDDGFFGNTIYIFKTTNGSILGEMYDSSVLQASFLLSSQSAGTYKAALGYANNNAAFFVNGVQVGVTDTSCSVPAISRIQLGNTVLGASTDKTSAVAVYTTRLSNSELAQLTTL